ncbi:MAG TPA: V-type ATP synthase subunit I [Anaerolineales bacterium]|nr:V-type ATP synthase subunit I [Anaerolineales bacterium]
MNVDMIPVEIIGLKRDLTTILRTLRRLGCVHIDELVETQAVSARPLTLDREMLQAQEELGFLVARLQGLLDTLGCSHHRQGLPLEEDYRLQAKRGVEALLPKVQELTSRSEKLRSELASLPRYEASLRALLPIIPPAARLPGNRSIGVLVSREHVGVLEAVGKRILELTAGQAELVARDVDMSTRAMLIVFRKDFTQEIEGLLGHEDVSRLRLPTELEEGPPDVILASLHRRMAAIPEELEIVEAMQAELAAEWCQRLATWRDALQDELETSSVLSCFGETDMTFVLVGWIPAEVFNQVESSLHEQSGEAILVQAIPMTPDLRKRAPIILKNPQPARPFESLVSLLALPRYGHIDPTRLMALFLPIFFGMILGDIGYGLILLLISLGLTRKFKAGVTRDVLVILAIGAGWSILFGFLYGEAFGTLGEHLGLHALWFERASAEHVAGLLVMSLAVGAIHLTLGLILGVWEAYKERSRTHLLDRGGMLVGLIGLFFIVAVLTDFLPAGFMTPAIVLLILGIVLMGASLGWLGVLMGPIEFIGLIGNILSYLRIAAIGLASVYLAKVANDIAGMAGNLIVGGIVALLIHALNLVLGAFSPTIHSLRLHYVEFFRKFYEGGGRPYQPFKSRIPLDQEL